MAARSPSPSKVVSLKLLIDKKANRVLYAEAAEAAVEFLCSLLTLPVATVIQLLSKLDTVGSLSNLYKSIKNLDGDYVLPNLHKDIVLKPFVCNSTESTPLLLPTKPVAKKFYRCTNNNTSYFRDFVTNVAGTCCPCCDHKMEREVTFYDGRVASGMAVVKGVFTHMVMDDLEMMPLSTITGITLINKLNVKDIGAVEERVVHLDKAKGLKLLKASFQTKKVLTEVFLQGSDSVSGSVKMEA